MADDTLNKWIKVISLFGLLGMAIGFGILPYFMSKCNKSTTFLSLANSFAGGLFLGIGLFHVLPESAEMLENLSELPVAYLISFGSYALILLVEKVLFDGHSIVHHDHGHCENHCECVQDPINKKLEQGENENVVNLSHNQHNHHEHIAQQSSNRNIENLLLKQNINRENGKSLTEENTEENKKNKPINNDVNPPEQRTLTNNLVVENGNGSNKENVVSTSQLVQVKNNEEEEILSKKDDITPYILLLALGFHGFFEGLSLGIQSSIRETLFLLLAIAAHKWAVSLTLGISFEKSKIEFKRLLIMVCIFALITPVGIALGLILSNSASDTLEGILLALSVGTFFYIGCSEVIPEEFAKKEKRGIKFLMFVFGGAFVFGLNLLELLEEDDD